MPITTAPNRAGAPEAGFTLVELLVVLSIMSLLAAIAASSMQKRPSSLARQQRLLALGDALARAKAEAARSGQPVAVSLATLGDPGLAVTPKLGSAGDRIVVYADGTSTGGSLMHDGHALASIDWLTTSIVDAR